MEAFWELIQMIGIAVAVYAATDALRRVRALERRNLPIGVLKRVEETDEGLVVEGQMFKGNIPGFEMPAVSLGMPTLTDSGYIKGAQPTGLEYDVLDMPDPETKALSYKFKFDREDFLGESAVEAIKAEIDAKIAIFRDQLERDGWAILDSYGTSLMDWYDIDFDQYKYRVEFVGVRKES